MHPSPGQAQPRRSDKPTDVPAESSLTMMTLVQIDTGQINDWDTFHDVFAQAFGFPDFYGRNMDAWIDCMTFLDVPSAGMSTVHSPEGAVVTLHLDDVDSFAERCPEQYDALVVCAAFVNFRRVDSGEPPVLALSYYKSS